MRAPLDRLMLCLVALPLAWGAGHPAPHFGEARAIRADDSRLHERNGLILLRGEPFTGSVVELDARGSVAAARSYEGGLRAGSQRRYWPDGSLAEESFVRDGRYEGASRMWFESGQLARECHYAHGLEEGLQRRWSEDGRLIANYVVRWGRRYGVAGQRHCYTPNGGAQ